MTSIEWTHREGTKGETWNPIVASGARGGTKIPYKPGHRSEVEIALHEPTLLKPLRWKQPRTIFVCSMTDLFGEFHSDEMIDRVFAVMALCPHTFQVLTKRADRMREYVSARPQAIWDRQALAIKPSALEELKALGWPLPNVWLGISAERQQEWDERKEHLRNTPATIHFASFEPLLGSIVEPRMADYIDWAIVGGESGPHARPMHPDWARSLRDQCAAAGVPYFFKQWGEHFPVYGAGRLAVRPDLYDGPIIEGVGFVRVGKKAAGRLLDGREHNEFPKSQSHLSAPAETRAGVPATLMGDTNEAGLAPAREELK